MDPKLTGLSIVTLRSLLNMKKVHMAKRLDDAKELADDIILIHNDIKNLELKITEVQNQPNFKEASVIMGKRGVR